MTVEALNSRSLKDLALLAKKHGVPGWHAMRKDQLVKALVRMRAARERRAAAKAAPARRAALPAGRGKTRVAAKNGVVKKAAKKPLKHAVVRRPIVNGTVVRGAARPAVKPPIAKAPPPKPPRNDRLLKQLEQTRSQRAKFKNLAARTPAHCGKDRLVVMVRDPFWLHAYWELTRHGVQRAEAALGQEWHQARPVLRLLEISSGGSTGNAERVLRDVDIHGGVSNWYLDVQEPLSYRLDIGYLAMSGRFFALARSNVVTPPKAGATDAIDENWADVAQNFDKVYTMTAGHEGQSVDGDLQQLFEERLRRPMGAPMLSRIGPGVNGRRRSFKFELDAEMIVYGSTEPGARVTLQGEPVKLRADGSFTVRYSLPNCRQVIPAVAASSDGVEQRTVILAVERNTKAMEPVSRDASE